MFTSLSVNRLDVLFGPSVWLTSFFHVDNFYLYYFRFHAALFDGHHLSKSVLYFQCFLWPSAPVHCSKFPVCENILGLKTVSVLFSSYLVKYAAQEWNGAVWERVQLLVCHFPTEWSHWNAAVFRVVGVPLMVLLLLHLKSPFVALMCIHICFIFFP